MTLDPRFIGRPHDFDFLIGHWHIDSRRRRHRLAGHDEWDEVAASSQAWALLDGCVSVDENRFPTLGFTGLTLRTLERSSGLWSIYWIDSTSGALFPPVRGGFDGDRGEFYGDDVEGGRAVQVRFVWTRQGPDRAHWEQAFSLDGREWEVNWAMQLRRAAPASTRNLTKETS